MGQVNDSERLIQDYQTAVRLFRGMNTADTSTGADYAGRAASAALLLAFSGDEPLEVWEEIGMKWALVACSQAESLPLAVAQ
jgi:hypothetical protein